MGMFDTLRIDIDGKPVDLQSKRFDQTLRTYRVGDAIAGARAGVQVYFDVCWLDTRYHRVFAAGEAQNVFTVFVILAHGIFVDFEVASGELDEAGISIRIDALRERWTDSARLIERLSGFVRRHQMKAEQLQHQIRRIQTVLEDKGPPATAKRPRIDLRSVNPDLKRLDQGEPLADVIAAILGDTRSREIWQTEFEAPGSSLEEQRL